MAALDDLDLTQGPEVAPPDDTGIHVVLLNNRDKARRIIVTIRCELDGDAEFLNPETLDKAHPFPREFEVGVPAGGELPVGPSAITATVFGPSPRAIRYEIVGARYAGSNDELPLPASWRRWTAFSRRVELTPEPVAVWRVFNLHPFANLRLHTKDDAGDGSLVICAPNRAKNFIVAPENSSLTFLPDSGLLEKIAASPPA